DTPPPPPPWLLRQCGCLVGRLASGQATPQRSGGNAVSSSCASYRDGPVRAGVDGIWSRATRSETETGARRFLMGAPGRQGRGARIHGPNDCVLLADNLALFGFSGHTS